MVGHRQAFAWIDDWYGMTMDDVREYEREMQVFTNPISETVRAPSCDFRMQVIASLLSKNIFLFSFFVGFTMTH